MNPTSLTPAERVALLIKKLDVTTYQFGKATGISHQTLSNVLTSKNKPGLDTLQAIAAVYPAAAIFLLTGEGEPFPEGRFNEKPHATPTETQKPEPAKPALGLTSGPATVAEAENILLRERLADKDIIIEMLRAELGKSNDSPDAAGTYTPTPRTPISGFMTEAQRTELAEAFNEYVEGQELGQVVEVSR
jgi:transcriptional regulator with XRE-family HTH domain